MPASHLLKKGLLVFCAIVVGVAVSLSVILFVKLFALVHNALFLGEFSFNYNEQLHTPPSYLGFFVIFVPVLGSFLVTWIIQHYASKQKGLSVPDIIYSIHFNEGLSTPSAAFAKAIASIISIGSGGSIGREGPLVQISAACSAIIGMFVRLEAQQRIILIGAGAAAGTALLFNAPLTGLIFVIEILLIRVNAASLAIIMIAETTALLIKYSLTGNISIFSIQPLNSFSVNDISYMQLLIFIPFGIILGLFSLLLIRGVYVAEDIFSHYFKNPYLKHAIGMLCVGLIIYSMMFFFGHYYVQGLGISTINDVLNHLIQNPWILFFILVFKLLATCFTLGTGGSGGIFGPSLFIGALFGALWGIITNAFFINADMQLLSYVIAGMTGMLACVTGGIFTSIVLCIELTKSYQSILPIIITVIVSFIVRSKLCSESIYILKLTRRNRGA